MAVSVGWMLGSMEVRMDSMLKESGRGRGEPMGLFWGAGEGLGLLRNGMDRRRAGGVDVLLANSGCFWQ